MLIFASSPHLVVLDPLSPQMVPLLHFYFISVCSYVCKKNAILVLLSSITLSFLFLFLLASSPTVSLSAYMPCFVSRCDRKHDYLSLCLVYFAWCAYLQIYSFPAYWHNTFVWRFVCMYPIFFILCLFMDIKSVVYFSYCLFKKKLFHRDCTSLYFCH